MKKSYEELRNRILSNEDNKKDYDNLKADYEIVMHILDERNKANMTQQELANITGIDRADISKLENGYANPTVSTLKKIAKAFNKELVIMFK